jgi:hypothetical protein
VYTKLTLGEHFFAQENNERRGKNPHDEVNFEVCAKVVELRMWLFD